jgi:hypothetical protein
MADNEHQLNLDVNPFKKEYRRNFTWLDDERRVNLANQDQSQQAQPVQVGLPRGPQPPEIVFGKGPRDSWPLRLLDDSEKVDLKWKSALYGGAIGGMAGYKTAGLPGAILGATGGLGIGPVAGEYLKDHDLPILDTSKFYVNTDLVDKFGENVEAHNRGVEAIRQNQPSLDDYRD